MCVGCHVTQHGSLGSLGSRGIRVPIRTILRHYILYIAEAFLDLAGGTEISSGLNQLSAQLPDSLDLLPTTNHLTEFKTKLLII